MISAIHKSMAAKRDAIKNDEEKGFTLIELLVVVLIIGILAAIAIPVFLSQREGAWESQVKSDVANAVIAAETYSTNNNGSYEDMTWALLEDNGYKTSPSVLHATAITIGADNSYTLVFTHEEFAGKTWTYTSSSGTTERTDTVTP